MVLEKLRATEEDLQEYDPLQLYRDVAGRMTQEEFCRVLGITDRRFRDWWSGKRAPSIQVWRLRAGTLRREWQQRNWI